jgi:hypothetical protein
LPDGYSIHTLNFENEELHKTLMSYEAYIDEGAYAEASPWIEKYFHATDMDFFYEGEKGFKPIKTLLKDRKKSGFMDLTTLNPKHEFKQEVSHLESRLNDRGEINSNLHKTPLTKILFTVLKNFCQEEA